MDDPNKPETEEEGIRLEALRRSQVRRALQVPRGQTLDSSQSQSDTPQVSVSISVDLPSTSQ